MVRRFNRWVAEQATRAVSTMWAAYAFAILAGVSLPAAIASRNLLVIDAWIAQTFLQLVLLSVIMAGQQLASEAIEQRDRETHDAVMEELSLARQQRDEMHALVAEVHELVAELHRRVLS